MEIVCMAEQIGVIENILRNNKRMWGGGWENCKDGGKTYNKGKTEMLDKTILPPYRLGNEPPQAHARQLPLRGELKHP